MRRPVWRVATGLVVAAVITGAVVAPASADIHCTTYVPDQMTCTSDAAYTDALVQIALAELLARQQQQQPPATTSSGVSITMNDGTVQYLAPGTFVRVGDAPAIYWVFGGQLHPFQTWPQFLGAGGHADLSNVVRYAQLRDYGGLFGAPVQN